MDHDVSAMGLYVARTLIEVCINKFMFLLSVFHNA